MGNDDCGLASTERKPIEVPMSLIVRARVAFMLLTDDEDDPSPEAEKERSLLREGYIGLIKEISGGDTDLGREVSRVIKSVPWTIELSSFEPVFDGLRKLGFAIKEGE
jgi:hypothetical protein